jgi:hypothetical protein
VEFAAYAAHLQLPRYFGDDEFSVPASWIAVVDLTTPGSPRNPAEIAAHFPGRTITYLPTASPRRAPTTLLLFAGPQPVPPLRPTAAAHPALRLPFGYRASRRRPAAQLDGVLLRADNPRWTADRFVAAGCMRGVHRDGGWYADQRGTSAARPGADPAWARPAVDRLDGVARVLAVAAILLGVAVALRTERPGWAWPGLAVLLLLAVACKVAAGRLYRRPPEAQLRPDKPSHRVLTGRPPPNDEARPAGGGARGRDGNNPAGRVSANG